MNQIVRVVGESLGYGLVGLYLREGTTDRMRVANYIESNIDITTVEISNPGNDWDILKHISGNSFDLKMMGGKRLRIGFGDDLIGEGSGVAKANVSGISEIWQMDEKLLVLVHLEGATSCGFLRVGYPLRKPHTGSLIKNSAG